MEQDTFHDDLIKSVLVHLRNAPIPENLVWHRSGSPLLDSHLFNGGIHLSFLFQPNTDNEILILITPFDAELSLSATLCYCCAAPTSSLSYLDTLTSVSILYTLLPTSALCNLYPL